MIVGDINSIRNKYYIMPLTANDYGVQTIKPLSVTNSFTELEPIRTTGTNGLSSFDFSTLQVVPINKTETQNGWNSAPVTTNYNLNLTPYIVGGIAIYIVYRVFIKK
jgi:hypothetical protein